MKLLLIIPLLWLQSLLSMDTKLQDTNPDHDMEEYLSSNNHDLQDFAAFLDTFLNVPEITQSSPTQPEELSTIKQAFSCDKCSNSYACENAFLLHYQREHGPKIYSCDFCTREPYAVNGDLQQHIRRKHKDKIPCKYLFHQDERSNPTKFSKTHLVVCSFANCNQTFLTHGEFREHYSKHEIESVIIHCPDCDKIYHSKGSYNHHRKIKHGFLFIKKATIERKKIHFVQYHPS